MQRADAITIEVIEEVESLALLSPEWAALWNIDCGATPFQSPEWLIPWTKQFCTQSSSARLFAVTAREHGSLIAILPFYVYLRPEDGLRELLLLGAGTTDYLDGVFSPEINPAVMARVAELLCDSAGRWDRAHLSQIRRQSPLLRIASTPALSWTTLEADPCFRIAVRQDLPTKITHNLTYYRRRAQAVGPLTCEFADAGNAVPLFEALVDLHGARWRSLGESGVLADRRVQAHHREAIPLLHLRGLLRLAALSLAGREIGVIYGLTDPISRKSRSFYYYLSGFDTGFQSLSPGTLVLRAFLDRAQAEGAEYLDLLRGEEKYKSHWGAKPVPTFSLKSYSGL